MSQRVHEERFYRPELDALRWWAFAAVFTVHVAMPGGGRWLRAAIDAGNFGVDVFFVISSYLITTLLSREWRERGRVGIGAFYARRALRIWPLYYFFLAIAFCYRFPPDRAHALGYLFFGANWVIAARGYGRSVAAPLWSVSIEEQFYVAWPLLLSLVTPRRIAWLAGALLVIAAAARAWLVWQKTAPPGVWCHTLARLDPIAVGALCARFRDGRGLDWRPAARGLLLLAGVALAIAAVAWVPDLEGPSRLGPGIVVYQLGALASGAIFLAVLGWRAPFASGPLLVALGKRSYGLYVFHLLAFDLAARIIHVQPARVALAMALTLAAAFVSYRFLERPFLRWKSRFAFVPSGPA